MNRTKKAIFESGVKVFSEKGFTGATMDEIAANAGLVKGTLYYHFKSKQEIFDYIISEGISIIKDEVQEAVKREKNYISKIRELCRIQLNVVYNNRDFVKVVMSELWGRGDINSEIKNAITKYISYIENNLKEGMESGEVRKGEPSFMAYTFLGMLCSSAVYEFINKDKENVSKVIDNLITYMVEGIGNPI
ncbi:TetR/AcrR family transcriptional regulator [Haloimpatiens sp. FM7315]|uniref:TetR/AcrR family transcriptional regulator n=1 Tax=Haloimpatiens sp. FM7315 TaxID=3298609 RepID=UPI0035A3C294